MKINIKEYKLFIFFVFTILAVNIGVSQKAPLNSSLETKDSLQIKANENELLKTPFGVFNLTNTTGSVFRISGDELRKTAGDNLINSLRGRVPGLRIVRTNNSPDRGGYSYSLNGRTPNILVDGQPRGLQVDLREVEEVIVLGDAVFNSLLGNLGDNGLIYVVTKGGRNVKPTVEVSYQSIISTPTHLPKHLSAAEYASVVNRASNNDGLGDVYNAEAIQAYQNGSDPINFPNVNHQDTFLEDLTTSNVASLNVYGGGEDVKYSAFIGYSDWKGLEAVGQRTDGRGITFRTKINTKLNKLITAHASVYGKFVRNDRAVINGDAIFSRINSVPANAYPLKVADTAYIVSNQFTDNLLAELEEGGVRTDYQSNLIFDLGLDFDFNHYVKGLTYSTYVMSRTNNQHNLVANATPKLYTIENLQDVNQQDSLALKLYQSGNSDPNTNRNAVSLIRYYSYGGNFAYVNETESGILNLNLSHLLFYQPNNTATASDQRNLTFNLNSSYAYKNKYIAYANLNSSSNAKFIGKNRTKFFPTFGAGWVVSKENFLKDSNIIDHLKFRASYGIIGTEFDNGIPFFLDRWTGTKGVPNNGTGSIYYGVNSANQNEFVYRRTITGNDDIDWITSKQLSAGFELKLLNKLSLDVNYFNNAIEGLITNTNAFYSDALGDASRYLPYINYSDLKNEGFNSNIVFRNNDKSFNYYIGANLGYNKITNEKIAEVQHVEEYRLQQGNDISSITGYVSDGLFTADNIDSALPQFGDVKIGDVKYVDQNNDNVIDERDQRVIGNSVPRINYGINVGFEFKGISLDIVGAGVADYDLNLTSSYYRHNGLDNYYASVNNNLPNGNANPRLSTYTSINNYKNSDYWLVDGSFFRIANIELGFSLPDYLVSKGPFSQVKLFLRGNNLAVFSKIKDLDPEDLNAGIGEYPMMRSLVLGASFNF
ncbi:SusC/RagA family TonB-linked outer membrane protein [Flavivirga jejuensis]|uniref:SusC/RagA family TonB-linked outer membrane protein n=1 Tax=Flavivirga jejuensis TaxID=870487 RepID=A0ABT8WJY4_9FLAO|nr:SusC/RagA family TonB-linked outer membrane protein [Flavivirga jejuensis]MDO5973471.1 SusC/RagA family TonB-linked outer membrane protein [Flavivirga jejuensis]